MPTILIRQAHNPTEAGASLGVLGLVIYSVFYGIPSLTVTDVVSSAASQLVWGFLCAYGAIVTLVGIYSFPHTVSAAREIQKLEIERSGQIAQGVGMLLYGLIVWDGAAFAAAGIPIGFGTVLGLSALARALQITRRFHRIRAGIPE